MWSPPHHPREPRTAVRHADISPGDRWDEAGANVKAGQRMLGHASASMTLDIYADLFDDDLEAVATALHAARASVGKKWAEGDTVVRDVYEPAERPDAVTVVKLDFRNPSPRLRC